MKIKVNKDLGLHKAGHIVEVSEIEGLPVMSYWRRRLKDAELDNCCEVVVTKSKPKPEAKADKLKTTKEKN